MESERTRRANEDLTIEVVDASAPTGRWEVARTLMREYAALPHTTGRWPTMHADIAALPRPFVAPAGVLLVASAGDEPLGCGALLALAPDIGEVKRMYVRPAARGRGVGEALLRALLAHADSLGFTRVRLDTAPELLAAQALYRRFGFTEIPPYRSGLLPDALCFERPVGLPNADAASVARRGEDALEERATLAAPEARRARAIERAGLSLLVPGLGQAVQGRHVDAAWQFGTVATYLAGVASLGGGRAFLLALLWNVWSVIDAFRHERD